MIRIRKISNPFLESNGEAISNIKKIMASQFDAIPAYKIDLIEEQLINPLKFRYQSILLVAENIHETILGFALLKYMPDLKFCLLDFIAASPGKTSGGLGGALYQRVREETRSLGSAGLFFECLPDDPALCRNKNLLEQNAKRLAFYERFGARPIINTLYETPVKPEDDAPPYLVFDGLGITDTLSKSQVRKIVRAILERIYADYCSEDYIKKVVDSVKDNPVKLRSFKYHKLQKSKVSNVSISGKEKILLIVNDKHAIHNIHQRGYVEAPVRIPVIKKEIEETDLFRVIKSKEFPDKYILHVHNKEYVKYFKKVCKNLPHGKSVYPYVFPIRNNAHPPAELSVRAGYYCIDTFTPLNINAYLAAREGVNCALTGANSILTDAKAVYILTRPPGHHAETNVFGGFCYFNNNAIAANYLSRYGKVAILDVDYHHGNGQQQIFYSRDDVLTISLHGHPSFAYPYFSGFSEEKGEGKGLGFNFNYPLDEVIDGEEYRKRLKKALLKIIQFKPSFLIVALGFDTTKRDPTGTWKLIYKDLEINGKMIGELKLPTLIVQEGGYRTQTLGLNAKSFFMGFAEGQDIII